MAETHYFLKIEGVPGEVTDKALPGAVELLHWQFGQVPTGVKISELSFTTADNKASIPLQLASVQGRPISMAVMVGVRNGNEFLRVDMMDGLVKSFIIAGSAGDADTMLTSCSLLFSDMKTQYTDSKTMAHGGTAQKPAVIVKSAGS